MHELFENFKEVFGKILFLALQIALDGNFQSKDCSKLVENYKYSNTIWLGSAGSACQKIGSVASLIITKRPCLLEQLT